MTSPIGVLRRHPTQTWSGATRLSLRGGSTCHVPRRRPHMVDTYPLVFLPERRCQKLPRSVR